MYSCYSATHHKLPIILKGRERNSLQPGSPFPAVQQEKTLAVHVSGSACSLSWQGHGSQGPAAGGRGPLTRAWQQAQPSDKAADWQPATPLLRTLS